MLINAYFRELSRFQCAPGFWVEVWDWASNKPLKLRPPPIAKGAPSCKLDEVGIDSIKLDWIRLN